MQMRKIPSATNNVLKNFITQKNWKICLNKWTIQFVDVNYLSELFKKKK